LKFTLASKLLATYNPLQMIQSAVRKRKLELGNVDSGSSSSNKLPNWKWVNDFCTAKNGHENIDPQPPAKKARFHYTVDDPADREALKAWVKKRVFLNTNEARLKTTRVLFKPVEPALPTENLTYHSYWRRRQEDKKTRAINDRRERIPRNSFRIRNGVLEALPGHELLRSDPGQLRGERTPAEAVQKQGAEELFEDFAQKQKEINKDIFNRLRKSVGSKGMKRGLDKQFDCFNKHRRESRENVEEFLKLYQEDQEKKVVIPAEMAESALEAERQCGLYSRVYGPIPSQKCKRCRIKHWYAV